METIAALTDQQLFDRLTPLIFVPKGTRMRAQVEAENCRIEAELNRRGYRRA